MKDKETRGHSAHRYGKTLALAIEERGATHSLRLRLEADKSSANRSARSMRRNLARLARKEQP